MTPDYRMLDPQTQALLAANASKGVAATHQLTPAQARDAYLARRQTLQPEPEPVGHVQDLNIPGPDGEVGLRLYRPTSNTHDTLPALVYLHGGGFVVGNLDSHDTLCRALCNQAGCAVIAVDYRCAPEHKYPAAAHDCLAATRWVYAHSGDLNIDAHRLAVGGDSAGGQLAAVVAQSSRHDPALNLVFQLLIYPITDTLMQHDSIERNGQGYSLSKQDLVYYYDHYFANTVQRKEPMASPLLAPDLSHLPAALVLTAGFDPLHDEGLAYANALSQAGNGAQYVCFARQIHGFILMGRVIDEAHLAISTCAQALKRAFHTETT